MPQIETKSTFPASPPIARIAGQSASEAALESLAEDVRRAREEGRLVQALPLSEIDEHHLVRDRIVAEDAEMAALRISLSERGQQVPVEVVDLGAGESPRYGLISGWRRLTALRKLAAGNPARFGTVLAVLRRPDSSAEAYRAMVEENEIRVGLSYYERARIVARAAGQGVFRDEASALSNLFSAASRAKRSKIGSFLKVHEALEDRLSFPAAIPERLGLALARALEDPGFTAKLRDRLRKTPAESAEAEVAALERALKAGAGEGRKAAAPTRKEAREVAPGIRLAASAGRAVLTGPGVTAELAGALAVWLAGR